MSEDDEQFHQAFGEHTGIARRGRNDIYDIRRSRYHTYHFSLNPNDADCFTNLAWRLLGRYIANNTHLTNIDLSRCGIADEELASLFRELTRSNSLARLNLYGNSFAFSPLLLQKQQYYLGVL